MTQSRVYRQPRGVPTRHVSACIHATVSQHPVVLITCIDIDTRDNSLANRMDKIILTYFIQISLNSREIYKFDNVITIKNSDYIIN